MVDSETLKSEARKHVGAVRNGIQRLFSGSLSPTERITQRDALIKEFDTLKKLFKEMNKIDQA